MEFVSIIMGSKSDFEIINETKNILDKFEVKCEMIVSSAHRTPARTAEYVRDASKRGAQVFICAAGMAAHLAGAVAANTIKPVLGVPVGGNMLGGADALYSTVQMPGGIPVGTLAIGKAGQNARLAAKLTNWKIDIKSETQAAEAGETQEVQEDMISLDAFGDDE